MSASRSRSFARAHCRFAVQKTAPPKWRRQPRPASDRRILLVWTLTRRLHSHGVKMCGTDNLRRQGPANALMNLPRHIILLGRGIEVESAVFVPILHDC